MTDLVDRLRFGSLFEDRLTAAREIERLRERLEMTHAWQLVDGEMARVRVELGSIPDGIEARDETIRMLKREIERLQRTIRLQSTEGPGHDR